MDDVSTGTASTGAEGTPRGSRPFSRRGGDEIIDLTTTTLTADYGAWRERMRAKAERNRSLGQPPADTSGKANADGPGASRGGAAGTRGYWSADQVYSDSARVRDEQAELLAVLDLRDSAGPRDIALAYRRLAKVHHPDRWAAADDETRQHHEDCMRTVNQAYQALRSAQRV